MFGTGLLDGFTAGQTVVPADPCLGETALVSGVLGQNRRHSARVAGHVHADEDQVRRGHRKGVPPTWSQRSAASFTPTSMDVAPVQFTWAYACTRSPTRTGSRKTISSIAAVTAVPPLCRAAAAPATSSTNFISTPPCTVP